MKQRSSRLLQIAAVFGCVAAGIVAFEVTGARQLLAPPTSVATVDLAKVLQNLKERDAKEVGIRKMQEQAQTEFESRQAGIKALEAQLKNSPELSEAERLTLEEQMALKTLNLRGWRTVTLAEIDVEAALQMQALYRSIREAAGQLANLQGYDMVLLDDSRAEFTVNSEVNSPRELQVRTQMLSRRLLFASDRVDITAQLIDRMNNAFDAGK